MDAVGNDPLLAPFLEARGDEELERALAALLTGRVDPVVTAVLRRFRSPRFALTAEDGDDLRSTVHLRLLQRLESLLLMDAEPIKRLEDYVATLTYRAVYDLQRRRFPARMRLKNRTRYLLTHDARFDLWVTSEGSVCGLRAWGRPVGRRVPAAGGETLDPHRAAEAVHAVLRDAGGPVALDDLVDVLADVFGVTDTPEPPEAVPATDEGGLESREELGELWREILLLRPNQRAALLLNLRDSAGGNALAFIHLLGLATFDEIAAAAALAPADLAALWTSLPLDDQAIAGKLGLRRQQVINLRKAARERLARRLKRRQP